MVGNKIFGVILLILGIFIILWGLYSSYNIFKGNAVLPQVFRSEEITEESASKAGGSQGFSPEQIQENMEEIMQNQLAKIFPPGALLKLLNLVSWSIFAWILIMGGARISTLGIKLLK